MPTPPTSVSASDLELVTSRRLHWPPAAVYAAFVDPAKLARWWGPKGFRNTFELFEPRPGGRWKFVMHGPDGRDYPNESRFDELAPGERLVLTHVVPPVFRATFTFAGEAGGTRLTFVQRFETAEACAAVKRFAVDANEQNLDRLEAVLVTSASPAG